MGAGCEENGEREDRPGAAGSEEGIGGDGVPGRGAAGSGGEDETPGR